MRTVSSSWVMTRCWAGTIRSGRVWRSRPSTLAACRYVTPIADKGLSSFQGVIFGVYGTYNYGGPMMIVRVVSVLLSDAFSPAQRAY